MDRPLLTRRAGQWSMVMKMVVLVLSNLLATSSPISQSLLTNLCSKKFMKCSNLVVGAEVSPAGDTLALVVDAATIVTLLVVGGRLLVLVAVVQHVVVVVSGLGGLLRLVVLLLGLGGTATTGRLIVDIGLSRDFL